MFLERVSLVVEPDYNSVSTAGRKMLCRKILHRSSNFFVSMQLQTAITLCFQMKSHYFFTLIDFSCYSEQKTIRVISGKNSLLSSLLYTLSFTTHAQTYHYCILSIFLNFSLSVYPTLIIKQFLVFRSFVSSTEIKGCVRILFFRNPTRKGQGDLGQMNVVDKTLDCGCQTIFLHRLMLNVRCGRYELHLQSLANWN